MHNDILDEVAHKTEENEFYSPLPDGYQKGKTKYVIVSGTVMSGLGKGIFASSLAKLLQLKGLNVSIMKFDGYLNQDAGTLNPFRHGEVFILDDGTESDMDLGTYERFLGINLTKNNYLTGGKLFSQILNRERQGGYLGRDVQFIPHVTGEIKRFVRNLAMTSKADVVFVEIGGTVGDVENNYFIEAMRELQYEEGKDNVINVALTYVISPKFLGEQKSKAAQLGLKLLMGAGIQPDIIACRCDNEVAQKVREKISVSANVPVDRVVSVHDSESIYLIPRMLEQAHLADQTIDMLHLRDRVKPDYLERQKWERYVQKIMHLKQEVTIAMTGKYTALRDSYASIIKALEHAGTHTGVKVNLKWIDTTDLDEFATKEALKDVQGIIVPGAFGSRGSEGKINCIKYARENNIPYLGLCYGFQMALIEYARNVCKLEGANSTEIDKQCRHPVIDLLPEQENIETLGGNMRLGGFDVEIKEGSKASTLYNGFPVRERFRHRWECNPSYIKQFEENGLVFSGKAPGREIMQILELPSHPYFVGVQCHPEFTSKPLQPNPLYLGFMKVVVEANPSQSL
ncbi:MAG: CTP synthetase [Nanoarchaeota archaeon]|nr:CTP synthetase [Nanoarchaeota archaeon]|tara:strand:- start:3110 stop:4822 length:1713 start_codon:yes stop_codon:yes gene_type:complete